MPGAAFGASYGGEQSAHQTLGDAALTLTLPGEPPAGTPQPAPATPPAVPVPGNDLEGAERSVTTDAAEDSAPQEFVVPTPAGPEVNG